MERTRTPSRAATEELNSADAAHRSSHVPHQALAPLLPSQVDELLSAERRKDEFLATLCHELRSPLGAIQNAIGILSGLAGQEPAVQQRLHALIERQVRHMMRLTADLLDVSRISRGQLHLQRERIDLRVVLHQAIETMDSELQRLGHRLVITLPDAPVWLQADATRLQQVFDNLLANGFKYTDPGGDLALSLHVRDGYAVVSLRDSGIGIAAETLPHIFDLFMQADPPARHYGLGLGIGLALVRMLVEMHGGSVAAMSAGVGQGSEFSVRLPVEH
jgi:two-component system, sensor histidine kinase